MRINATELTDIVAPQTTRKELGYYADDENFISMPSLEHRGPMSLEFNSAKRYTEFVKTMWDNDKLPFLVEFPDGSEWAFEGFVTGVMPRDLADGNSNMTVEIRPSGQFNVTTKEDRMFPKGARNMPANPPADLKPFYIGSNAMPTEWSHSDLKTAVAHANELLNDRSNNQDSVFIVKVIKVVRRKSAPIEVVNFKTPRVKKTRG